MKTVIGLFDTAAAAQRVVQELIDAGINRDEISLVANNASGEYEVSDADGNVGAGEGAAVGAVGGGLLGLLAGLGALAIPGIGPIVAAGPLAGALAGALAGGVTGGVVGALVDLGVSDDEASYYAEGIRRGGTLVTVKTDDAYVNTAVDIMNRNGAIDINNRAGSWRNEGWTGYDAKADAWTTDQITADRARYATPAVDTTTTYRDTDVNRVDTTVRRDSDQVAIPVVEENIDITKREVESGGVRVRTETIQEPVNEQVTLREEHVNVERRPVDRPVSDADLNALHDGTIEVTTRAEEAVVRKDARVVEEVVINKDVQERVETVQDTVRRTDVHVEEVPGNVRRTATDFSAYDADWRSDFDTNYASSGYTYDQYRPAYEYGYGLANDSRYTGRSWDDIEMDARRDWESRYADTPWDDFKQAVRSGWERTKDAFR